MTTAQRSTPPGRRGTRRFFAALLRDYVPQCLGRSACSMQCVAPLREPDIATRAAELIRPAEPAGLSSSVRITCAVISWLTRRRFAGSHDELLYMIR